MKAYAHIVGMLSAEGYKLSTFPSMPNISDTDTEMLLDDEEQINEIEFRQYERLNEQQKQIVDVVLNKYEQNAKKAVVESFYIDGSGGYGKTYIYTTLCSLLKNKNKKVCTMAFTGIAATLLPHGRTVHKTFGLPVRLHPDSCSNIKASSKEAAYLNNVDVFIWDKAPMAPKFALEIIDSRVLSIIGILRILMQHLAEK